MRPYEVRWANLPEPIGRRPVLLLTRTSGYEYLAKVMVAEITGTIRGIAQEILLGPREGLARRSVANCDSVHVIPQRLLGERMGALSSSRAWEVKRALGFALDWDELKALGGS
jgi:mRNA interferase MazF